MTEEEKALIANCKIVPSVGQEKWQKGDTLRITGIPKRKITKAGPSKLWPFMLKGTHEKIIKEISHRHADMEERYWRRFSFNLRWEEKYRTLEEKYNKLKAKNEAEKQEAKISSQ